MLDRAPCRRVCLALVLGIAACGADRHETTVSALPAPDPASPTSASTSPGDRSPSPAGGGAESRTPLECEACAGTLTWELQAEMTRRARRTKACYDRALAEKGAQKKGDGGGKLMVRVRVGPRGNLCSDEVVLDEIGNEKLAACVRKVFAGEEAPLPAPAGGCIDVNVPLNFVRSDAGAGDSAQ